MILILLVIIGLALATNGTGWAFAALAAGLCALLAGVVPELGWQEILLVLALGGMIPIGALLTGALLDRFAFDAQRVELFTWASLVVAGWWILKSPLLVDYLEAAVIFARGADQVVALKALLVLGSQVVFVSSLVAFVCIVLDLAFELPLAWLLRGTPGRAGRSLSALRVLILLLIGAAGIQLVVGLFASELHPEALIS